MTTGTFEQLVAEIKALNVKWHEETYGYNKGRLICERGDCAVGALLRSTQAESAYVQNTLAPTLWPTVTMAESLLPWYSADVITRVINANDGPTGMYAREWLSQGMTTEEAIRADSAYLRRELGVVSGE